MSSTPLFRWSAVLALLTLMSVHPARAAESADIKTLAPPGRAPWNAVQLPVDDPGAREPRPEEPGVAPTRPLPPLGFWDLRQRGPRMKFGYRTFVIPEMSGRSARFHLFSVDRYFISSILRGAGGLEGGFAPSSLNYLYVGASLALGVQYPCRLTPFFDVVSSFGLARREAFHQNLFGFSFHFGLEAGLELYVLERALLSLSVGWRRPSFYHSGNDEVASATYYYDTFTFKVGLGF